MKKWITLFLVLNITTLGLCQFSIQWGTEYSSSNRIVDVLKIEDGYLHLHTISTSNESELKVSNYSVFEKRKLGTNELIYSKPFSLVAKKGGPFTLQSASRLEPVNGHYFVLGAVLDGKKKKAKVALFKMDMTTYEFKHFKDIHELEMNSMNELSTNMVRIQHGEKHLMYIKVGKRANASDKTNSPLENELIVVLDGQGSEHELGVTAIQRMREAASTNNGFGSSFGYDTHLEIMGKDRYDNHHLYPLLSAKVFDENTNSMRYYGLCRKQGRPSAMSDEEKFGDTLNVYTAIWDAPNRTFKDCKVDNKTELRWYKYDWISHFNQGNDIFLIKEFMNWRSEETRIHFMPDQMDILYFKDGSMLWHSKVDRPFISSPKKYQSSFTKRTYTPLDLGDKLYLFYQNRLSVIEKSSGEFETIELNDMDPNTQDFSLQNDGTVVVYTVTNSRKKKIGIINILQDLGMSDN